jgi:MoaA/NifB/PqqE/SkfB family radical SAM enzyme
MSQPARVIQIDASSHCQLACSSCPTADGSIRPALGAGHLALGDFIGLLDRNPTIAEVELSNYGEMFLNPALAEIMRAAFERRVVLHADNGVNLNFAREEALEGLVRYRFRSLTVSIDGATQETYAQYRIKGDLNRVLGHIERINRLKREHRSGFPLLTWQFIVFGHNEHEIAAARKMAADLGMGFRPKLSWDDDVSPIRNRELVQIALRSPALTRAEYYAATGKEYMRGICHQLWKAPVLNWDGRVTGCCRNFWGDFGSNAFEQGLETSLASEKVHYAQDMLMGLRESRPDIPCTTCDLYRTMQRDRRWLTRQEVTPAEPAITLAVFVESGGSEATHADVFCYPGHAENRLILARPPAAARFEIGRSYSVPLSVPGPGEYTLCALPRRLDPSFRRHYPPLDAVTRKITVPARPTAQQFVLSLGPGSGTTQA